MRQKEIEQLRAELGDFLAPFRDLFFRDQSQVVLGQYVSGLLMDGERKSIEPLAAKISGARSQNFQQFIADSKWDSGEMMRRVRTDVATRCGLNLQVVALDDTAFPKKGKLSVGVAHQYCGVLGKLANCQSVVSLYGIDLDKGKGLPLAAELYLPEDWCANKQRLDMCHVPEERRTFRKKWEIALDLIDEVSTNQPVELVLCDSAYGGNSMLRERLDLRNIPFLGQCHKTDTFWFELEEEEIQFLEKTPGMGGRPQKHPRPWDPKRRPMSCEKIGEKALKIAGKTTWIRSLQNQYQVQYAAVRVQEVLNDYRIGVERWMIVEILPDGSTKYYISSLPKNTKIRELLQKAHMRWKIEQSYQQLKEELGLDHYEGRSWRGVHHHMAVCFLAYSFLVFVSTSLKKSPAYPTSSSQMDQRIA